MWSSVILMMQQRLSNIWMEVRCVLYFSVCKLLQSAIYPSHWLVQCLVNLNSINFCFSLCLCSPWDYFSVSRYDWQIRNQGRWCGWSQVKKEEMIFWQFSIHAMLFGLQGFEVTWLKVLLLTDIHQETLAISGKERRFSVWFHKFLCPHTGCSRVLGVKWVRETNFCYVLGSFNGFSNMVVVVFFWFILLV